MARGNFLSPYEQNSVTGEKRTQKLWWLIIYSCNQFYVVILNQVYSLCNSCHNVLPYFVKNMLTKWVLSNVNFYGNIVWLESKIRVSCTFETGFTSQGVLKVILNPVLSLKRWYKNMFKALIFSLMIRHILEDKIWIPLNHCYKHFFVITNTVFMISLHHFLKYVIVYNKFFICLFFYYFQVCGLSLSDNVVEIVFHLFDTSGDGNLSSDEFIRVLHKRERDIAQPVETGIMGFLSCCWNCTNTTPFSRLFFWICFTTLCQTASIDKAQLFIRLYIIIYSIHLYHIPRPVVFSLVSPT